jgi:hypothetical protein
MGLVLLCSLVRRDRVQERYAGSGARVVTRPQQRTLDQLPLFADDSAIGAALFGPNRAGEWPQIASLLETRGLPKIDALMGGRYVPAVRAFFDRDYGLSSATPLVPDGTEDLGAWKRKRRA